MFVCVDERESERKKRGGWGFEYDFINLFIASEPIDQLG